MNIYKIFSNVKDPRNNRGKRYNLAAVLRLITVGLLSNFNSLASIARFGKSLNNKQVKILGFGRGTVPCHSNLTLILRRIDPESLAESMLALINKIANRDERFRILRIDGKYLRGSNCFGKKQQSHILKAFNDHFNAVYAYKEIENRDEFSSFLQLLGSIDVTGKIITADAAFAHQEACEVATQKGANFAFSLKKNEANLYYHTEEKFKQIDARLANGVKSPEMLSFSENIDSQHGRIEQRKIDVIQMPFEYLNGHRQIKQICRITRYRERKNIENSANIEVAYMITSLSKEEYSPEKLLSLNRGHWSCENNLNWVKDVVFQEDKSTISMDNAPIVTSLLRSFAMAIINTVSRKIKETREAFIMNFQKMLKTFATISGDF
jgi:predicted transposase YbfD/YdcC